MPRLDKEQVKLAKEILWPNEVPEITVQQRRIGPGASAINPTTVIGTDRRLIIINRATLGMRKDYEVIPYRQITSVRLEKGIMSSSVFVRVEGYDQDKGLLKNGKQEGEIDGLNNNDAKDLADSINKHVAMVGVENISIGTPDAGVGAYRYCTSCGTKNSGSAKFCTKCGARLET